MHQQNSTKQKLKNSLKKTLTKEDLKQHQALILHLTEELGVSVLECAAALAYINQPGLSFNDNKKNCSSGKSSAELTTIFKPKFVRYRLNVGHKHQLTLDEIKNVLVEVAGVDRKNISRLDIRNYYTLVDLPDGMPADIFQLLSETELHQQKLNIKRIKFQSRFHRRNNKKKIPKPV